MSWGKTFTSGPTHFMKIKADKLLSSRVDLIPLILFRSRAFCLPNFFDLLRFCLFCCYTIMSLHREFYLENWLDALCRCRDLLCAACCCIRQKWTNQPDHKAAVPALISLPTEKTHHECLKNIRQWQIPQNAIFIVTLQEKNMTVTWRD